MAYLFPLLLTFLRTILVWLARRLVLIIVVGLASNFWESIRDVLADLLAKLQAQLDPRFDELQDQISLVTSQTAEQIESIQNRYDQARSFREYLLSDPDITSALERADISVPELPEVVLDTLELRALPEALESLREDVRSQISSVLDDVDLEQIEEALRSAILEAPQEIMEQAAETVQIEDLLEPSDDLPKIQWGSYQHKEQETIADAQKWQINDIYRILVRYFTRQERLALALQIGKKDYFKEEGKNDRKKKASTKAKKKSTRKQ